MNVVGHLVAGGIALFWIGAARKVQKGRDDASWRLGPDAPAEAEPGVRLPRLAVVIPARDEAANIGDCVRAVLASDHPDVTVLVFDDASTDGTADLARAAGAIVVTSDGAALPDGWKGKPWALHRATEAWREGRVGPGGPPPDWILFLDADVRVAPEALSRAHAYAIREGVDFFTGFGRLTMGSFWEKVVQPSVGGLIISGNNLDKVNAPKKAEDLIANGQFILVRREAYVAAGGHEAVRSDILDDVGLARAFYAAGLTTRCLFTRDLFSCRMYTTFSELWLGWTKNLYAGLHHRPLTVVAVVGFLLVYLLSPYLYAPYGLLVHDPAWVAWGVGLVVLIHAVRLYMDGVFGQDRRYGLLQPLGTLVLIGMLLDSQRRSRAGAVQWKGRTYAVRAEDDTLRRLPQKVPAPPDAPAG